MPSSSRDDASAFEPRSAESNGSARPGTGDASGSEVSRDEHERVAALRASGLLDTEPEDAFDRLTRLARHLLGVPVSLVSLVDDDRQFFKSHQGLGEPWCTTQETPLSHSFCQYVVARRAPLVVGDARKHALVRDNLAIRDLDVVAYLGVPVHGPDGHIFGSLCAIDSQPRTWTDEHIVILTDLARAAENEVALQHELRARKQAESELYALNASLESRVANRTEALFARTEQVRDLTRALTLAEQRERRRLAHVLHDDLQQLLFGIQLQVQAVNAALSVPPDEAAPLTRVIDLLDRALTLTRTLSHELAPPALDEDGLEVSLAWLAEQFSAVHDLCVTLESDATCHIPDRSLRALLVQLVRELLFNIVKHANVDTARIYLRACDESAEIVVEDDGDGFDPDHVDGGDNFGMRSVRERVELIGGHLTLDTGPGRGTRVSLVIPIAPLEAGAFPG